jgi:hypothetical protein
MTSRGDILHQISAIGQSWNTTIMQINSLMLSEELLTARTSCLRDNFL